MPLALLIAALLQAGSVPVLAWGHCLEHKPLVGLAVSVREGGGPDELVRNIVQAKALGVRHMHLPWKWRDLEPKPGEYNLRQVDEAVSGLGRLGFHISTMLQTIDTNNRTLPEDLANEPFDSPRMLKRWEDLLKMVVPRFTTAVRWVALGNEVDIYLKAHPREVKSYARFLEHGRKVVHELSRRLQVSVTVTHDGVRDVPQIVERLMKEMDTASFTYYPLKPDMTVRPVADVPADMGRMVKAAGGRPILFQELGYPAGELNKSDEEKQAAFVDACFDFVRETSARVEAFTFFMLHDFNREQLDELERYYRITNPSFRSFLATLGLKRADGVPRRSWARFEERTRAWPRG